MTIRFGKYDFIYVVWIYILSKPFSFQVMGILNNIAIYGIIGSKTLAGGSCPDSAFVLVPVVFEIC